MSDNSNKLKTVNFFPIGGTIDYNMRDYSNEPVFVRKNAEARKSIQKLVWPEGLLEEIKESLLKRTTRRL